MDCFIPPPRHIHALCLIALSSLLPLPSSAAIISGTWNFSAGSFSGSFSFTGLNTDVTYSDSTTAGFSASLAQPGYDTTNLFSYNSTPGRLMIGGSSDGVGLVRLDPDATDTGRDWFLGINNFPTTPVISYMFLDSPGYTGPPYGEYFMAGTIERAAVPEPATIALMGLGLAGLGLSRRKTKSC